MQRLVGDRGVTLRPHAKTHKSIAVGRMQLAAGAVGLTVGTVGEAEVFARAGVEDLFLAYPVWASDEKSVRLRDVAARARLRIGVDSVIGARRLASELGPVEVVIEVDSGEHRTGAHARDVLEIASAATDAGLQVVGVFTHGGHSYDAPDLVAAAADDEVSHLAAAFDVLREGGFDPSIASAGSTPTAILSARSPVTEERPGTYVFGDRQQAALGGIRAEDVALFVAATVVGNGEGRLVLDCGAKTMSKDRMPWIEGFGALPAYPGLAIAGLYDYHAVVPVPPGTDAPAIGEVVAVIPNHACPVVNLADRITVVLDGRVVDEWTVDARGRNA
jgi:D-serine deaminase-like pyridoxal phosphate-dependent protein